MNSANVKSKSKATWRQNKVSLIRLRILPILLGISLLVSLIPIHAFQAAASFQTQSAQTTWSTPENISRSGAASQPRIFSGPNQALQVFWVDRFDGLVSSVFDGAGWSQPAITPLLNGPAQMPVILYDRSGWLHAFWQASPGQNSPYNSLYHAKMLFGDSFWTTPELLAEDALAYAIDAPVSGGLRLAYVRRINTQTSPSGVYVKQLLTGGTAWGAAQNIYSSIYYRLLSPGNLEISIADDGESTQTVIWTDPYLGETLVVQGNYPNRQPEAVAWQGAQVFENEIGPMASLRQAAIPAQRLSIWQAANLGRCGLYQQAWNQPEGEEAAQPSAAGETGLSPATGWSTPEQIYPNLEVCPLSDVFWAEPDQGRIYWLWGEGTSSLSLSAWDVEKQQWSIPVIENFSFDNPGRPGLVVLTDLHAAFGAGRLAIAGYDSTGEIWVTQLEQPITEFAFAPAPAWEKPLALLQSGQSADEFALAMDAGGRTHLVFTLGNPANENLPWLGASLQYSAWDDMANPAGTSQVELTEIVRSRATEIIRQPAILLDEKSNLIHLVWSGGEQGDILYSRAPIEKAGVASEWFPSQVISTDAYASWPQLGQDASGRLYLVYAIAVNEGRGIYLTTSTDRGQSWEIPTLIFDAAREGLNSIDHPSLVVTPEGSLYLAWAETAISGNQVPQGIFYMSSDDGGGSWSAPLVLAGPGNNWPRIVLSGDQIHLLYAQGSINRATLWERTQPLAGGAWSPAARIPGWNEISLPFGATVDGLGDLSNLHLVGVNPEDGSLYYSLWNENNWSNVEKVTQSSGRNPGRGVLASTRLEGGRLAVAWLSQVSESGSQTTGLGGSFNQLFVNTRSINAFEIQESPTEVPTPTPTATPAPTATITIPTPTPDFNLVPAPSGTTQMPLILGGTLASLFVILFFTWRLVFSRRK
jgi:hypothetical protein